MKHSLAVVDAHVHIHACYPPDAFFDRAYANLTRYGARGEPAECFLLMTECAPDHYFSALLSQARGDATHGLPLSRWAVKPTAEPVCVAVEDAGRRLFVVGGRQVACREGLEVLILGTERQFEDGRPIRDVLQEAAALGVPHVIPWGPGKWFFSRGKLVSALMAEFSKPLLFLGDEGGRPGFWPYPSHFAEGVTRGVRDLPGTDPLPFAHDLEKVGRVGFRLPLELDPERPAASLFRALASPQAAMDRFARLEPPLRFVRNQVAMQLRKRRAS
jgi:hypothetical protein